MVHEQRCSVEQREWKGNWEGKVAETVGVKVEGDSSVFWIGYDGDYVRLSQINRNSQQMKNNQDLSRFYSSKAV